MAWVSCVDLRAWFLARLRFVAVVSFLVARRWVGPRALWWLWCGALISLFWPDAYLWLDPLWLNLGFSLALTICESWALFFLSSWCVGLVGLFLRDDTLH